MIVIGTAGFFALLNEIAVLVVDPAVGNGAEAVRCLEGLCRHFDRDTFWIGAIDLDGDAAACHARRDLDGVGAAVFEFEIR